MDTKFVTAALLSVFFVVPAVTPNKALADDDYTQNAEDSFTYENRYNWSREPDDYVPHAAAAPVATTLNLDTVSSKENKKNTEFEKKSFKESRFEDRLLDKIPYGEDMKEVWKFVDGDTDVMSVEGLRVERRNKGVAYTTNKVPFVGEMEGMKIKFSAGDDMKVSFESDHLPLFREKKGFKVKASTGNEDSKIFIGYTMKFD